jgi:hypothetical protein
MGRGAGSARGAIEACDPTQSLFFIGALAGHVTQRCSRRRSRPGKDGEYGDAMDVIRESAKIKLEAAPYPVVGA